jgi:hypothetical protein
MMAARRNAQFVRATVGDDDDTSTSQPASVEIQDDEYSPAAIIVVRDDEESANHEAVEVNYQGASDEDSSPVE